MSGAGEHDAGLGQQRRRAVVLSDSRAFRDSLCISINRFGTVDVVGTGGGPDAAEKIRGLRPAIILLDGALSGALGVPELARSIIPNIVIMVFAASDNNRDFLKWAETGISGYLDQHDSLDEVHASINRAIRGELVCSPLRTALLLGRVAVLSAHRAAAGRRLDLLTTRENEVMALLAQGLANKVIARRLGVSEATVKNHVHSILEKTGSNTRSEAAAKYRVERPVAADSLDRHRFSQTATESKAGKFPKVFQPILLPMGPSNGLKNGR
jgi:DNA-binding NarL/FixJ family response regulator